MLYLEKKLQIRNESKKRIGKIKFGDVVTNICAGDRNPMRISYFVRYKRREHLVEVTDRNGKFSQFDADVIYPGELPIKESKDLFDPVWENRYGSITKKR